MGGMAGDLVVACLSPDQLVTMTDHVQIRDEFCALKEYWRLTLDQRKHYLFSQPGTLSSHDTQLHQLFDPKNTLQLVCSLPQIRQWMARRFFATLTNPPRVIGELGLGPDHEQEYERMILDWQNHHVYQHRLDMRQVLTDQFIDDLARAADQMSQRFDRSRAQEIHDKWLDKIQQVNNP
jgi:hypothetical protein